MTNQKPSTFPLASDDKYWGYERGKTYPTSFNGGLYDEDVNSWWKEHREFIESNMPDDFCSPNIDWDDNEYIESYVEELEGIINSILEVIKK